MTHFVHRYCLQNSCPLRPEAAFRPPWILRIPRYGPPAPVTINWNLHLDRTAARMYACACVRTLYMCERPMPLPKSNAIDQFHCYSNRCITIRCDIVLLDQARRGRFTKSHRRAGQDRPGARRCISQISYPNCTMLYNHCKRKPVMAVNYNCLEPALSRKYPPTNQVPSTRTHSCAAFNL